MQEYAAFAPIGQDRVDDDPRRPILPWRMKDANGPDPVDRAEPVATTERAPLVSTHDDAALGGIGAKGSCSKLIRPRAGGKRPCQNSALSA